MKKFAALALILSLGLVIGCSEKKKAEPAPTTPPAETAAPEGGAAPAGGDAAS